MEFDPYHTPGPAPRQETLPDGRVLYVSDTDENGDPYKHPLEISFDKYYFSGQDKHGHTKPLRVTIHPSLMARLAIIRDDPRNPYNTVTNAARDMLFKSVAAYEKYMANADGEPLSSTVEDMIAEQEAIELAEAIKQRELTATSFRTTFENAIEKKAWNIFDANLRRAEKCKSRWQETWEHELLQRVIDNAQAAEARVRDHLQAECWCGLLHRG